MMSDGIKVLLVEDVENLGWLGDVIEVNAGYARNYLLPEKAMRAEQRLHDMKRLESAAAAVDGAEAVVAATANEQGHLFGSVGKAQIAANLREQGFEVSDDVVQLRENIKAVGTSEVTLKFTDELNVKVSVVVVAAGGEGKSVEQEAALEKDAEDSEIQKAEASEQRGEENESSEPGS